KKKKKKKSKTANLPEAGTVLQDDYQEKFTEDVIEDPYDVSRPLARRVEYAIWKYRRNHKFSQENKAIFDHYLRFGGVDTSPNAFLGRTTSADTPDDPDAEADFEAAKTATDAIDLNDSDDENGNEGYVSFSEVVQVYLGKVFVHSARFISLQDYLAAPVLIDSFLRYLQIRNVCPEYSEDLTQARLITAQAKEELPRCKRVSNLLPGDFNMALGILFGGEVFPDCHAWAAGDAKIMALMNSFLDDVVGMNPAQARRKVVSVVPDIETEKVVQSYDRMLVKITQIKITPSCDDNGASTTFTGSDPATNLAKVTIAKYDEDSEKVSDNAVFDLYFEKEIADEFLLGMVMVASMRQLTSGLWYLVRGYLVCPSFYKKDE
ncbi:Argonaute complex, subunit Arb1, partial [Chlamydoabsidia padenii]